MLGAEQPRVRSVAPASKSAGEDAIGLAEQAGMRLLPWQKVVLEAALGERPDGKWAAKEVGLVVSRQNGKTEILTVRELFGLYLAREEFIVHSAHEFKTSQMSFQRILSIIEGSDTLSKRVERISRSNGEEGIELKARPTTITGADGRWVTRGVKSTLRFFARTGGSGRGFSGDTVILDEAYNLPEMAMSALIPTMLTKQNPQTWFASSAVDQKNPSHQNGHVLARIRRRALRGDDPTLTWCEWSVDEDAFMADPEGTANNPEQWAVANPSLGTLIPLENLEGQRRTLPSTWAFATEILSVGDWPADPSELVGPIPLDAWDELSDPGSLSDPVERVSAPSAFGVSVSPRRDAAAIAVASRRPDGLLHVEVVSSGPGVDWVVARVVELYDRHHVPVALGAGTPAASLLPALTERHVPVEALSAAESAQAFGAFFDAVMDAKNLRHLGQPELSAALRVARTKPVSDGQAWSLKESQGDITPLVAATHALFKVPADSGGPNIW